MIPDTNTVDQSLQETMGFLRKNERVLICFPKRDGGIGKKIEDAVIRLGGAAIPWGEDLRWKTLLRQAFSERISTIIGPPTVILGLSKLAYANGIPLSVRNVMTAGAACQDWMKEGIVKGLDCKLYSWDNPCNELTAFINNDPVLDSLRKELHSWTSILDCRMEKGTYGLELEVVAFTGRQMPKLPSCAKLVVRPWEPEVDIPFGLIPNWENLAFSQENH